ncbi:Serine/threonine-protein phosphatase PP2A catalytic subunit [Enhygromyxa salina]|uniref:Serine/threonine-protein phosphatase PP2A catalytic subunit n=1 Tax=Enhygromyxa salina TaxID=215803 RepID=A0A0C1ZGM0_9BACT|nr:Serine/threonine-protein phosphatase PP2A catalytic subunit [Enhygromyxa salina]
MIKLSLDPRIAEQQIEAVIFYLTTCGYIDSEFDLSEKAFVRAYLRKVVTTRIDERHGDQLSAEARFEAIEREHDHYVEVFQQIDREVKELFTEAVADGEDIGEFVKSKLKLRAFEMFKDLDADNRAALLGVVDEFIGADGVVHPEEVKFRNELAALLDQDPMIGEEDMIGDEVELAKPVDLQPRTENHPFFTSFEHHYSADPSKIRKQIDADVAVLDQAQAYWDGLRAEGAGKLSGVGSVDDLEFGGPGFLDGHVHVVPPSDRDFEMIVLGDLHGCYSCLKGALMQADFMEKVKRYRADPANNPEIKLVLLGDYIDRGRFSYNGILRTVLKLLLTVPEHVYVLRGNHEYYIEYQGRVYGGVRPAEAINSLVNHVPDEVFERYLKFFDSMPNMLIHDRMLFVHAGIPRDALIRERWQDMSTLNDPDIRFQMLWSDPSRAEVIPEDLQAASARFPFGRKQFRSFMSRLGCNLMARGHEKVNAGFKSVYRDDDVRLLTVFSAGGLDNDDIPADSNYRDVRPMALTITRTDGELKATPWEIDYARYQSPALNGFKGREPEIDFVE